MIIIINLTFCISVFVFIGGGSMKEESSTVLSMMIVKKFQKDINKLSVDKIMKRYFYINRVVDKEKKAEFMKKGFNKKEMDHYRVYGKTTDGKILHTNLTHSSEVNFKKTMLVDKNEGSYMVSDLKEFDLNYYPETNELHCKEINVSDKLVENINKSIEQFGKKFENPKLESIKNIDKTITKITIIEKLPIDKI